MLSPSQESALQFATQGRNLFITGPAGSGKSFVASHIRRELTARGKECVVVTNHAMLNTRQLGSEQVIIVSNQRNTKLKSTGEWGRLNFKRVCL